MNLVKLNEDHMMTMSNQPDDNNSSSDDGKYIYPIPTPSTPVFSSWSHFSSWAEDPSVGSILSQGLAEP